MGGVDVQVHVVELEAADGGGDALLVDGLGLGAGLDARVGDQVGEGVGLQDDGKRQVGRSPEFLDPGREVLGLVALEAPVLAVQLARALARTAVAVRQVVEHQPDDLGLARLRLHGAGLRDGRVDVGKAGNVGHPDKGTDVLDSPDLFGIGRVAAAHKGGVSLVQLLGPRGVRKQLLSLKGVGIAAVGPAAGRRGRWRSLAGAHGLGRDRSRGQHCEQVCRAHVGPV